MKIIKYQLLIMVLFSLQFVFADNHSRNIDYGNSRISYHPDSLYFHFASGTVSGDPTGMDIMITGNEGTNFGNEGGYFGTVAFADPSQLFFYSQQGSLDDVIVVPSVDDPFSPWVTVSWSWMGGNGGMPLQVGDVWVVYTRTTHCYAVLEITQVNLYADNAFSFNYMYQPDGSTNFSDGEIYGCTDLEALNYNPDATMDDGSCYTFLDCNDDPDGSAFWDECGTCVGGNTGLIPGWSMDDCGQCFGLNEAMDCAGVCFGDAYEDACGSCDNIPENDCEPSLIYGSATLSAHPDSIYFSFEQGVNSSDTTGMDIMISGNEGTNFGSEARYVWDGLNWVLFPAFDYPSPIYYLSPDSSLASITSVPMVDENWPTISWDWPNGNGGQPLAVGNVWVVYCRTTHNYAVMEVTIVTNSWDYPRFSFNYYFQPDGSTNFSDGEIYGCTEPDALNYNPDATMDDGSCYTFLDCNNDPDGSAFVDDCDNCVGGNTGLEPDWAVDDCGICFGQNQDMDCNGVCFGGAYEDACGICDNIPENDCEPSLIYGSATLSAHPDSIYFSFEQGINGSDTTGMDIMISGNEGTNFGSEARYVWDGLNWVLFPAFDYPSPIYYLSPDSSLASITSVPMVDENWPTISWDWPNGNGGQPLAVGNVWAVYCRTTHNYAVMEVTNVTNSWDYPRFSFNYYYQPDGSSNFSDGEIYGCTDPEALNYNPDATMDDGSCYTFLDCNDDPDGSAFWDECATCVGGNTGLIPGWSMDDCGQCSGMNEVMDCNEDCFGSAFVDNCGECVDGNTGLEPYWALDDCGICFGDNQNMDCAGVCFGEAYEDDCGVCDNIPGNDCEIETDCAGVPDGNAFWDDCGLCVGGTTGLIPNEGCAAQIISINDVQNDQGGRVYVTFNKSPADDSIPGRTTEGYTVERLDQIDGQSVWIAVISGYAYGQDIYIYEVTTLLDSSDVSDGLTGFRIISGMDEGTWISENDYGYSVDNIAPSPPAQLLLAFTSGLIILDWDDIVEPDYQYFTVYRDNNQMGYAVDSHFIDTTFVYGEEQNYYVTATDNHGNESLPSNVETVIGGSAGDVNGDSDLNVSDLVILVDMILGGEYEEYQAWAGDLNGDGVLNVLDIVIVVDLILNGGLSRGDLLYEAQILYGNGELLIKGTGSIAGVQLQLAGEYQLTQTSLPIGWESHHMNGMLLLFDSMGAMPINDLKITYSGDMIVESALTADWYGNGLMADIDLVPEKFSVKPSFPNPFNPETNISFELPIDCYISIVIYDGVGRKIESLLNENIQAGYHSIKWNASGRASGIYYVKLIAPEYTKTQKVVLLK